MKKRSETSIDDNTGRRNPSLPATPVFAGETSRSTDKLAALEAETALYRTALENSRQEMQAFAYSVSHDLRAPLRAIEGFSKIILEDFAKGIDPEAQRFLKHIISNTETLGSQIEDLLQFYRIGKNPPNRIPANADALCREVMATLPPEDASKITIPSKLPEVFGDPVQLREVFSQLLENALKFTGQTPDPRIEVRGTTEANATKISVHDNGAGFDPKHASKMFQVFQKLHAPNEFSGNGIGLAIVKRVVQAHGGVVEAKGTPGQGATFSFTLPRPPSGNGHPA